MRSSYTEGLPHATPLPARNKRVSQSLEFSRPEASAASLYPKLGLEHVLQSSNPLLHSAVWHALTQLA